MKLLEILDTLFWCTKMLILGTLGPVHGIAIINLMSCLTLDQAYSY